MNTEDQKEQVTIDEAAAKAAGLIKESKPEGRRRKGVAGEGDGRTFLGIVYPQDADAPKRPWKLSAWSKWAQAHLAKVTLPTCSNPARGTALEEAFSEGPLPYSSALGALLIALGARAKGLDEPDLIGFVEAAEKIGAEAIDNYLDAAKGVGLTRATQQAK